MGIHKSPSVEVALEFVWLPVPGSVQEVEHEDDFPHLGAGTLVLDYLTFVSKLDGVADLMIRLEKRLEEGAAIDFLLVRAKASCDGEDREGSD
jgi:hypothetical protein